MKYKTLIGLEIHAELLTDSKIFCGCSTIFGKEENTQCCPICLGLPGTLPVINKRVIEMAIRAGFALNCEIAKKSKMDRKHYFYPDLPKAYQISQYNKPLCTHGKITIEKENKETKEIRIRRIHIEEDAGKSIHPEEEGSLVDYNRAGVPLIEIVTEPDMTSSKEACQFLEKLKAILQYIGVSDCKMEQGSLRCDLNINVQVEGNHLVSEIVEIKNLNSFKAVGKAIEYEEKRHIALLEKNKNTQKETRRWDEEKKQTILMRRKEYAEDYRYFSDPDLVVLEINEKWVKEIQAHLPELPADKQKRFIRDYDLPLYDAEILTSTREMADYFEDIVKEFEHPKMISNWIMTELYRNLKEREGCIKDLKFQIRDFVQLLKYIEEGIISNNIGKKVFHEMYETGKKPETIVKEKGWIQVSDENLIKEMVQSVVHEHPQSVIDYKSGKERVLGFLVGKVMKMSKGKANPQIVNTLIKEALKE
ncbi:Asp-tRNA(Asn)/Glu-tRNA(Gln) amidotransferase subunit GatB [Clostridiaceae bacterium 35-E11]